MTITIDRAIEVLQVGVKVGGERKDPSSVEGVDALKRGIEALKRESKQPSSPPPVLSPKEIEVILDRCSKGDRGEPIARNIMDDFRDVAQAQIDLLKKSGHLR